MPGVNTKRDSYVDSIGDVKTSNLDMVWGRSKNWDMFVNISSNLTCIISSSEQKIVKNSIELMCEP